jgi:Leucine-rich repeat (LRR) protein
MQIESITSKLNDKTVDVEYHQRSDGGIVIKDLTIKSLRISACGVRLLNVYNFAYLYKLWIDGDIVLNWIRYLPLLRDLTITGARITEYQCELPQLRRLRISNTYLTHVDTSRMSQARSIDLSSNFIKNAIIGTLPYLHMLNIAENNLSTVDISGLPKLKLLNIGNNNIQTLDVRYNTRLATIDTSYNKGINIIRDH